jgi:anti-sigma factor RsiW
VTCRDVTDAVSAYVSGELSAAERAGIDAHLPTCVDCANYVDAFRRTLALAEQAFDDTDCRQNDLPETLVNEILERRRRS